MNYKSVKWVLLSLNLCNYTRVSVREHLPRSVNYLGGGFAGDMIRRFGDRLVMDSSIYEGVLILYVVPPDQQLSDHWGDWCDIGCTDGGMRICSCTGSCSSCSAADGVICPIELYSKPCRGAGKRLSPPDQVTTTP